MKDFTLWLLSFFTPFLAESLVNIIKVSSPEIVAGENPAISPIILFILVYFLITFGSFTLTLVRDNMIKCKKPGWGVVIKRNIITSFFLTLIFSLIINIPLKKGIAGLASKALESQSGGAATFQELEVERIVGSMMPFINGIIMTPFVISSIMVGNAMSRAAVCKNELEYPKLPVHLSTLPHYKSLSTLPDDNVNLRQKIVPREETTRSNVYRVCWSDLIKKKQPNRHFTRDECRGWDCKVANDTCGGTPEKPLFTCVDQPNPGLCKDPPCWFGNDGNRTKYEDDLLEDDKFRKLNDSKKSKKDKTDKTDKKDKKGKKDKKSKKNEESDITVETKLSKCPDGWGYVGDSRCQANNDNRGVCDEIMGFENFSDGQKREWAKKCSVNWTDTIPIHNQKSKKYSINGTDSTENRAAAVIYSNGEFKGNKLEVPSGGGHCPDLEEQDPDILWNFTKEGRACEGPNGTTFSGSEFGSVKLHPDYQLTAWRDEGFKKGAMPPITVKGEQEDLQYEIGPTNSYVVCKKSEADKKGNCKPPKY
jgi:CPW-WPC domain-containing protein